MSKKTAKNLFSRLSFLLTAVLPLLLWMVFIYLLSNREKVAFTDNYPVSFAVFKSLHLVEYGILWLLWYRCLHFLRIGQAGLTALLFTFAYGLSDELHQSFVTGREGKILDATVDALGGLVAWTVTDKVRLVKNLVLKRI